MFSSISCPRILTTRDRFKNDSSWTFRGSEEMLAHCLIRSLISMLRPIILLQGPHLGPCHPAPSALHAVKTLGVGTDSQFHTSYYAFCLPSPGSRGCLQLLHSAVQFIWILLASRPCSLMKKIKVDAWVHGLSRLLSLYPFKRSKPISIN